MSQVQLAFIGESQYGSSIVNSCGATLLLLSVRDPFSLPLKEKKQSSKLNMEISGEVGFTYKLLHLR